MIHNWIECKVRYDKMLENGFSKKTTEHYLFDALSFTEAEARVLEEVAKFITTEFTVNAVKKTNYSEIFYSDEEAAAIWFKCKVTFITLDEKSGSEKKTSTYMLVQAANIKDALQKLDKGMDGTMADYKITAISETPIMDVYPYETSEDEEII